MSIFRTLCRSIGRVVSGSRPRSGRTRMPHTLASSHRRFNSLESLEDRTLFSFTAFDQLALELINRARLNPIAEVQRTNLGNDQQTLLQRLNTGVAPNQQITADPKEPLVLSNDLITTAETRTNDQLTAQTIDTPILDIENIKWGGTSGQLNTQSVVEQQSHIGSFLSTRDRVIMLNQNFNEIGISVGEGVITASMIDFNAAVVTSRYASTSADPKLTGVAYDDNAILDDDFYSPGEELAGLTITAINNNTQAETSTTTTNTGYYDLTLASGTYTIVVTGAALGQQMQITTENVVIVDRNVKVDFLLEQAVSNDMPREHQLAGGLSNAIQFDAAGNLYTAFHDTTDGTLKFATRDANAVWSANSIIDNTSGEVGIYVDMALDSNGLPGVAYYDAENGDLKYAKFDGANWAVETVHAKRTVGLYPSLAFDASDNPAITYYHKTNGDALFATKMNGAWEISTVEATDDVGRYTSLAMNPNTNRWSVAYENTTDGRFRYADQTDGGTFIAQTIDPTIGGGGFTSLSFDTLGNAAVTYYDSFNADLKFAQLNGGTWNSQTIAQKNSQGLYTNLIFDNNNNATIIYFNKTNDSLVRVNDDGSRANWVFTAEATGGGRWAEIAVNAQGQLAFTWYETSTESIWFQLV